MARGLQGADAILEFGNVQLRLCTLVSHMAVHCREHVFHILGVDLDARTHKARLRHLLGLSLQIFHVLLNEFCQLLRSWVRVTLHFHLMHGLLRDVLWNIFSIIVGHIFHVLRLRFISFTAQNGIFSVRDVQLVVLDVVGHVLGIGLESDVLESLLRLLDDTLWHHLGVGR